MNGPYWRKPTDNVASQLSKLPKAKAVSYLAVHRKVHGGSITEIQYWKTLSNGYMICVDVSRCKIGVVLGFPLGVGISGSNKREYDKYFKKVLKLLQ